MKYITLLLVCSVCLSCTDNMHHTNTTSLIDSISFYLDTLPQLKTYVINKKKYWQEDQMGKFIFYPIEYDNLKGQLRKIVSSDESMENKQKNISSLLTYILSNEIKEYKSNPYDKKELKKLHNIFMSFAFYKKNNLNFVADGEWFDSDKILVIIGQKHDYKHTEEERKIVEASQNNIFAVSKLFIAQGISLSINEGMGVNEVDKRIPKSIYRKFQRKDLSYTKTIELDSLYPNLYTYGCEYKDLHSKADSLIIESMFFSLFLKEDSTNVPTGRSTFIDNYKQNIKKTITAYPNLNTTRFDSIKAINYIKKLTKKDSIITLERARTIQDTLSCNAYQVAINERNKSFMNAIDLIFKITNKQIAILKIGEYHLHRYNYDMMKCGFSEELITIQDLCEKNKLSYIVVHPAVETNNDGDTIK